MDVNVPEKVLKYEAFLNDVLKEELKKIHLKLDRLQTEIAEYIQIKSYVETIKDSELSEGPLKTQVDIGCNFFLQGNIDDPKTIYVDVGCGYFVEFKLEEALFILNKRINFLEKHMEIYRQQSANTKAHIKMVLLGLMELQKIK